MQSDKIEIIPVTNRSQMLQFIKLPWSIYADDPAWIPPLRLERRLHFSRFNPFFKSGSWQAWLACKNSRPVGRICAQINTLYQQHYGQENGHFGLIEGQQEGSIFAALTGTAEKWLAERNITRITGPYNFSVNQECGLLVEGFETPPVCLMPHSRKWYGPMLQQQGYIPEQDLLAYWVKIDFDAPPAMVSISGRYRDRIRIRPLRRKQFAEELELMRDIFNDAWSQNWGFVPMTREEFADLGNSLRLFIEDSFVQIAEVDNSPAAFMVTLPNLNEVFREMDGKLLPFGWLKLMRYVRQHRFKTGRVPLMGVRRTFQHKPIGLALAFMLIDKSRREVLDYGIDEVEMSWILESNRPMISILESIGSILYKRYRIYGKNI